MIDFPAVELAKVCRALGMPAIEGINSKFYPEVMELGLKIAIVGSHGFASHLTTRADLVVPRPERLSPAAASALPFGP